MVAVIVENHYRLKKDIEHVSRGLVIGYMVGYIYAIFVINRHFLTVKESRRQEKHLVIQLVE